MGRSKEGLGEKRRIVHVREPLIAYEKGFSRGMGSPMRYQRPAIERRIPITALMGVVISVVI